MWFLLVGVAVGYPLWRAYGAWDAKRFRRNATEEHSQLWFAHTEVDGTHETCCIHFPSMILEQRIEHEGTEPRSRLFHVRRIGEGQWQRALTEHFHEGQASEVPEPAARPGASPREDSWEPFGDSSLEDAYQRFAQEHQIEGPHQDGIPRRTRRSIKMPTVG